MISKFSFILVVIFCITFNSCNHKSGKKGSRYLEKSGISSSIHSGIKEGYFLVTKVVDGDTFWVNDGSPKGLKIRLIGIDTPETRNSANKKIGYFGKEATQYMISLIANKKVRLEYDINRFDRYQRTLAYVYLEDGTFVNAKLVKNGYAMVMTIPPNVRFADEFVILEREARESKKGLWQE